MIDYQKIQDSINFYLTIGYSRIESPWVVSNESIFVTLPQGQIPMLLNDNRHGLVGSAEQSFIEMNSLGILPTGKIQSVTPCFRDEKEDALHKKWFIKNELIITGTDEFLKENSVEKVVNDAKLFFEQYFSKVDIVKTDSGLDIEYKKIELGSYGKRTHNGFTWVYGTGCAEPRLSTAIMNK